MNDYQLLAESDRYMLIHIFEDAYLVNKLTNKEIFLEHFYGDPSCGLISFDNSFCFVGGYKKSIVYKSDKIFFIEDSQLDSVFDVKQNSDLSILILNDPWSENSAIWQLDIETLRISKVQDFFNYRDQEYTDEIIW